MRFKKEDGFTLILSFVFLTVLLLLGVAISSVVINEFKASHRFYRDKQSYYYARSGAEYAIGNADLYNTLSNNESYSFKINNFNKNSFNFSETNFNNADELPGENDIEVFIKKTGNHFKITSKGKFNQQISKLSVNVKLATMSLPNLKYALFTTAESDNAITLKGSSTIIGDVGTNSTSFDAMNFNGTAGIDGNFWINTDEPTPPPDWSPDEDHYDSGDRVYHNGMIYEAKWWTNVEPGTDNSWERQIPNLTGTIEYLDSPIEYPIPKIPEFPEPPKRNDIKVSGNGSDQINTDGSYDTISLKSGTDLTIDRNGGDRIIRVKNFDITNGHIKFANPSDDGVLKIYIEDDFTFGADSSINKPLFGEEAIPENVEIYYAGADTPKLGGNITINGSLFIDKADFDFGGSNSTFGYIFSNGGNITVRGGSSVSTLYAPNTNIEMKGLGNSNSILKGSVIAKEFKASGAAQINYVEPDLDKMPDDFLESIGDGSGGEADDKPEIMKWSRN